MVRFFEFLEKIVSIAFLILFIAIFVVPLVAFGLGLVFHVKEFIVTIFGALVDAAKSISNLI